MEEFKGTKGKAVINLTKKYVDNPDFKGVAITIGDVMVATMNLDVAEYAENSELVMQAFNVANRSRMMPEQMEKEMKDLKTTIGAYKVLQSNHDIKISHYSRKAQDINNAIQSLDSERKMNEILTNEKEDLEARLKEAERLTRTLLRSINTADRLKADQVINTIRNEAEDLLLFLTKEKTK